MGYEKVFPFWLESPLECTYVTADGNISPFIVRFMVSNWADSMLLNTLGILLFGSDTY